MVEVVLEETLKDGTRTRAKCCYWAKDVCVEMISPYPGLHTGSHIMYMSPYVYTVGDRWRQRAVAMMEALVLQGRWMEAHAGEVDARCAEAQRRIHIAQSHIDTLRADRREIKRQLKSGTMELLDYQRRVTPIRKTIKELRMIQFGEREEQWLRDGIIKPMTFKLLPPYPSARIGMLNLRIYSRPSGWTGRFEEGWNPRIETSIRSDELEACGLKKSSAKHYWVDPAALVTFLKMRGGDPLYHLVEAWLDIDGHESEWCAMAS